MLVTVLVETLSTVHVFDGEEVVIGGDDGQAWVATFADANAAERFVNQSKRDCIYVMGWRR